MIVTIGKMLICKFAISGSRATACRTLPFRMRTGGAQAQLLLVVAEGISLLARAGTEHAAACAAIDVALAGLRRSA